MGATMSVPWAPSGIGLGSTSLSLGSATRRLIILILAVIDDGITEVFSRGPCRRRGFLHGLIEGLAWSCCN